MQQKIIEHITSIAEETAEDKIIRQIQSLIADGLLQPGDRLPPERQMAEKFSVGRGFVRDAIRKLEFYGILKTIPQSGTYIAGIGADALKGLINNVLQLTETDFSAMAETRYIIEIGAARLAAERRTDEDLLEMKKSIDNYTEKANEGHDAIDEDLMFHICIGKAAKNSALHSLLLTITPDIIDHIKTHDICGISQSERIIKEHTRIYNFIKSGNAAKAATAMHDHLFKILEYTKQMPTKKK